MTTESFIFSQLNFNGDENQRRKRKISICLSKNKKENFTPKKTENSAAENDFIDSLVPKNRPITMSLFATSDLTSRRSFDPSKYVLTPKGYIHNTIFPKMVPTSLTNVHYLTSFPQLVINDALVIFSESGGVLQFVLDQILQLPCNVPIRWGVLFNLKFRRVFQCLTLEKWTGLYQVLKKHGYGIVIKGSVHLLDPALDAPETINFNEYSYSSFFERLESSLSPELSSFKTPERNNNPENSISHNVPIIEPSNSNFKIHSPHSTPIQLPLDSPSIIPVQRVKNNSIYAIHLSHSISPALADRFDPSTFSPLLVQKITEIYNHCDSTVEAITNHLKQLPIGIPLRWGFIYNKLLRVRSSREVGTSLDQWKQLKSLLITEDYLCEKTVANCAILKNKNT